MALASNELWFHEDDYQKIQFLPAACRNFCLDQIGRIEVHGEAHGAPEGVGWARMYEIPSPPRAIASLGITKSGLEAAMPWRLRRIDRVLSGTWSEDGGPLADTAAFGAGGAAIVYGWNDARTVDRLWFIDGGYTLWRKGVMLEALFRLNILAPMLVVDWSGYVIDLGDRSQIRAFLAGRAEPVRFEPPPPPEPPQARPESLHRFDAPVFPELVTRKHALGAADILVSENDVDRAWTISVHDGSAPETPRRSLAAGEAPLVEWWDVAGSRIVTSRIHDMREAIDIWNADGSVVAERLPGEIAVLVPDGNHVLLFEDRGISVLDLRRPEDQPRQSGLFPMADDDDHGDGRDDVALDNPGSVMAVAAVPGAETFTLAIGDYGFAVAAELRIGDDGESPLELVRPALRLTEGIVYDPVQIVGVTPGRRLVVLHGSGAGLARFDLSDGSVADCPLPEPADQPRYSAFRRAVAAPDGETVWVSTDRGPRLWTAEGALIAVSEGAGDVLATDGERFVGLTEDGWDLIAGSLFDRA